MSEADHHAARFGVERALLLYCRGADRLDESLIRAAFHADARIELGAIYQGDLDGFLPVAMGFMGAMAATRHEVTNMLVEPLGETAGYEAYVRAWHRLDGPDGPQELLVLARYAGQAALRAGRWAIIVHSEVMDWGEIRSVSKVWFESNAELPKGRRDQDDLSYSALKVRG